MSGGVIFRTIDLTETYKAKLPDGRTAATLRLGPLQVELTRLGVEFDPKAGKDAALQALTAWNALQTVKFPNYGAGK